jgi:hypothetical protein
MFPKQPARSTPGTSAFPAPQKKKEQKKSPARAGLHLLHHNNHQR